jgi:hypothetical protein
MSGLGFDGRLLLLLMLVLAWSAAVLRWTRQCIKREVERLGARWGSTGLFDVADCWK